MAAGVTSTTVGAVAAQDGATVAIDPADADAEADGHQVALTGVDEIAVTVTSADGSRERVYRVAVSTAGPPPSCLRGAVSVGFSLVAYEGGTVDDLVACAERRHVTALYVARRGAWVSHILGAPDFVNASFRALFADGVPALHPLVVRSEGPATPAPPAPAVTEPFAACLRGEVAAGFSLVVYEGGSVGPRCLRLRPWCHRRLCSRRRRVGIVHPRRAGVRERPLPRAVPGRCPGGDAADRTGRGPVGVTRGSFDTASSAMNHRSPLARLSGSDG